MLLLREGRLLAPLLTPAQARTRCQAQLAALHPTIQHLAKPDRYPVGLERSLHEKDRACPGPARLHSFRYR